MTAKKPNGRKPLPAGSRERDIIIARCVICTVIFIITSAVGVLVFTAVCRENAGWSDIPSPAADTDMSGDGTDPKPPYGDGFLSDMSGYEEYINPIRKMRDAFLTVYGKNNPVSSAPDDISVLPSGITAGSVSVRLYPGKALEAMFTEMEALGIPLTDTSGNRLSVIRGYISKEEQQAEFDAEVARILKKDPTLTKSMAESIATVTVSRPGEDEHQSGLSADISFHGMTAQAFRKTDTYLWLKENSWKFGFILRYPAGKEDITGSTPEPWHFRYVGRHHAAEMYRSGLCLEEYIDSLTS